LPTYSYARVYKKGDVLAKHVDRDACEISLTIHLDGDEDWSIYIENPSGDKIPVTLKSGDALLYLGCTAPHWRESFTGNFYSQVFLHYVRSNDKKSYTYFDKVTEKTNNTDNRLNSSAKLKKFINIFENILSEELCDKIISEYANDNLWSDSKVAGGRVDTLVRNCKIINMSFSESLLKNLSIRKDLDDRIFNVAGQIINQLRDKYEHLKSISKDTGYDLLKYDIGGFYTQHTDSFTEQQRTISCSFILNDDYEGGEFAFFDRELKYKLKKGSAITFPSNFMFPHEIMPVTKGTRYSIITWFI
jgi:predicted 2-oxoglutarate/Fe(II)-dependent dioxygenase YbiX